MLPERQEAYASDRCADGQELEYHAYEGDDHVGVTTDPVAVEELLAWTEAPFAGEEWTSRCDELG